MKGIYKGERTNRRYHIVEPLNHSGMSKVFFVRDQYASQNDLFVMKLAKDDDRETLQLLEREIKNNERVSNFEFQPDKLTPFLERVTPLNSNDQSVGFVMEYIEHGLRLDHWFAQQRTKCTKKVFTRLTWKVLWRLVRLITALHKKKFLHNDLKPANIMVVSFREDFRIYLLDLGIARHLSETLPRHIGTKTFSAPECIEKGLDQADESSDIYALIQTWVRSLVPSIRELTPRNIPNNQHIHIPKPLEKLFTDALKVQKQRKYRYSYQFLQALTDCLLFEVSDLAFSERIATSKGTFIIQWNHCPLSDAVLPHIDRRRSVNPIAIAERDGVRFAYMRDIELDVEWSVPGFGEQVTYARKSDQLRIDNILPWPYKVRHSHIDIHPKDESVPSQRLFFPLPKTVPKVSPVIKTHQNKDFFIQLKLDKSRQSEDVGIFLYNHYTKFKELRHSNGQLQRPQALTNRDDLYYIWDRVTLQIIDVFASVHYSGTLPSCKNDPIIQKTFCERTRLLKARSTSVSNTPSPFTKRSEDAFRTMAAHIHAMLLPEEPQQKIYETLQARGFQRTDLLTIFIKLTSSHRLSNRSTSYILRYILYAQYYKVTLQKHWVLYYLLSPQLNLWPLYSGPAQSLKAAFSNYKTVDYINHKNIWNETATWHKMQEGAVQTPHQFTLTSPNATTRLSLFEGSSLTIGRWSTEQPPHVPLLLSPAMPRSALQIDELGRLRSQVTSLPLIESLSSKKNRQSITLIDIGMANICRGCWFILPYGENQCGRGKCSGKISPHRPSFHELEYEVDPKNAAVLIHTKTPIAHTTALNAFTIENHTVLRVEYGNLFVKSKYPVSIFTEKGSFSLKADFMHALPKDTHTLQIQSHTLSFH